MEHAKRYFVTGTDTGVGKTFVTCALAQRARKLGRRVFAYKPVETGVSPPNELGEDQAALVAAAGGWQQGANRGEYQFQLPAAPLVAARLEKRSIDVESIAKRIDARNEVDLVLIEGAGGLRVPITETIDMARLAKRLASPLIIVARAGLGTINHSLLTIEAAEHEGLKIAALVLSKREEDDLAFARSNVEEISRRWRGRIEIFDGVNHTLDDLL